MEWTFVQLVVLIVPAGMFGGACELLLRLSVSNGQFLVDGVSVKRKEIGALLLASMLIGVAGAAAAIFIFSSTTWFHSAEATVAHQIWICSMAVIAGFSSRRILPTVAFRLQKQLSELDSKYESRTRELEERSYIRDVVARALGLLGRNSSPSSVELHAILLELQEVLKKHPVERRAAILAARIHRRLEEHSDAIRSLTSFIGEKNKRDEHDADYADAHFNRACYRCLLWNAESPQHPSRRDELKREGYADLLEAAKHNPQNVREAQEDEDLAPWRQEADFPFKK